MSGVVSVGAAIAATAVAASTVASVGLTVGAAFAIVGAVGATVGAIGVLTKVKELQIAGAALGAVGLVGGLSSAAGLFGEAGSIFGSSGSIPTLGGDAAGFMGGGGGGGFMGGAEAAMSWAGTTAAPTLGYGGASDVGALMDGNGIVAGEIPGFDAIDMANGIPQVNTGTPEVATAGAPDVTPEVASVEGLPDSQGLPAYDNATPKFDLEAPQVEPPPVSGETPDPARSLLNNMPIEGDVPRDAFGNVISQGGDPVGSQIGPGTQNRAAPGGAGFNEPPTPITGTAAPTPSGVAGADNTVAGFGSGSMDMAPAAQVTDVNSPSGGSLINGSAPGAEANISGFAKGTGPVGPSGGSLTPDSKSVFSGILDFIQKNQTLSYGAMQTMGSFVSGALKPGTDQTILDELKSRAAANQATKNLYDKQAELLQQRLNNMNAPFPMATRSPSLINGGYAVTGRVG